MAGVVLFLYWLILTECCAVAKVPAGTLTLIILKLLYFFTFKKYKYI